MFSPDTEILRIVALMLVIGPLLVLFACWKQNSPRPGNGLWLLGLLFYSITFILVLSGNNVDYLSSTLLGVSVVICAFILAFALRAYQHLEHELEGLQQKISKESSLRVEEVEERLLMALEFSNAGAWDWNINTNDIKFSDAWIEALGYSVETFAKDCPVTEELIHLDDVDVFYNQRNDLLAGKSDLFQCERRILRKDGTWAWMLSRGKLVASANGERSHRIVGTDIDVTYLKTVEAELKKSIIETEQAKQFADLSNKAKTTFLANMSHEIRTPLNAILGFSHLLQDDPLTHPSQIEVIDIINKSGEHLLELIDNILNLSRIESGNFKTNFTCSPTKILFNDLARVFTSLCNEKSVSLELELSPKLPEAIMSDIKGIRQICTNLIGNALKFTEKGVVTVNVSVVDIRGENGTMIIRVIDTGVGIAPKDFDKVFGSFEQTQSGIETMVGSGLGLNISKKTANLLGGDLVFTSEIGKGSCFTFSLPIEIIDEQQEEVEKETKQIIGFVEKDIRLLVVDDIESNRLLLKSQLDGLGFEIKEAESAQAGIALVNDWQPSLVLMDIRMPDLPGDEAIERIRCSPKFEQLPIIAMTANVLEGEKERLMEVGANEFISKPFFKDEIVKKLQVILNLTPIYTVVDGGIKPENIETVDLNTKFEGENAEGVPLKRLVKPKNNILIVDDNLINQHLLRSQLKSLGFTCESASDGEEGIKKWLTSEFDIILTDCSMPVMDGIEMARNIRTEEAGSDTRTRIIAITGAPEEFKQECEEADMDNILSKPLHVNDLTDVLKEHLNF